MKKRKTPPELARVILERHASMIEHIEEMLRVKRTVAVENQADHVSGQTEGEMVARAEGYNRCLEDVMHEFNCYAGFNNYGPAQENEDGNSYREVVGTDHPDFLRWRVLYYTNGIAKK